MPISTYDNPISSNLLLLNRLRFVAVLLQACLAIYAYYGLESQLNYTAIGAVISLQLLVAAPVQYYWITQNREPEFGFLANLYIDIFLFSCFLYFTGGPTNPFVSYMLIPLTISAATLSRMHTWTMATVIVFLYAFLINYYQPLTNNTHNMMGHNSQGLPDLFNLHVIGMWANFVLSAIIISYFVVTMSASLKQKDAVMQQQRDRMLVDEQVLAITSLAAGTAHELATPLNTLLLLSEELAYNEADNPAETYLQLQNQLTLCRNTLDKLKATAEFSTELAPNLVNAQEFFATIIERWQLLRPQLKFTYNQQISNEHLLSVDNTIAQSILNLLNNCAEAQLNSMALALSADEHYVYFKLTDDGPGFSVEAMNNLGRPFSSNKPKGFGIGLFLSHTAIKRHQGNISIVNNLPSGATVTVTLPRVEGTQPNKARNQ